MKINGLIKWEQTLMMKQCWHVLERPEKWMEKSQIFEMNSKKELEVCKTREKDERKKGQDQK